MQAHISESLAGLRFTEKYNLVPYLDSLRTLVIFGMYRDHDLYMYERHPSELIVVWQGSDALKLPWIDRIKAKKAKHYAISHWIKQSLDNYGIENELLPISATIDDLECCPRGDSVYFYSSDQSFESSSHYGEEMIEEIKHITGLNIIRATLNTYNREELIEVYKQCFVNLRLTVYDGCPNTNLEMGLMGRRSFFNGHIPHSIKWDNVYRLCDDLVREYECRHQDNRYISSDIKKFVNIPNKIFYEKSEAIGRI